MSNSQHQLFSFNTSESLDGRANQGYPYSQSDYELKPDYGSDYDDSDDADNPRNSLTEERIQMEHESDTARRSESLHGIPEDGGEDGNWTLQPQRVSALMDAQVPDIRPVVLDPEELAREMQSSAFPRRDWQRIPEGPSIRLPQGVVNKGMRQRSVDQPTVSSENVNVTVPEVRVQEVNVMHYPESQLQTEQDTVNQGQGRGQRIRVKVVEDRDSGSIQMERLRTPSVDFESRHDETVAQTEQSVDGSRQRRVVIKDDAVKSEGNADDQTDPEIAETFQHLYLQRKRSSQGSRRGRKSQKRGSKKSLGLDDEGDEAACRQLYDPSYKPRSRHELMENIKLQKEIIASIRTEPWRIKRKLKTVRARYQTWPIRKKLEAVRLAKAYVERYEGRLSRGQGYQERGAKAWRRFKREMVNMAAFFTPWEIRIKKIESHFGSVVSSYFTFLRWLLWVNILLTVLTACFIIMPEIMVGAPFGTTKQKSVPEDELGRAMNFETMWNFDGYLKYSVLFYGYYGSDKTIGKGYRLPLAYLLTVLASLGISFIIVLRRMAANSRLSKLAGKDEQFTFSWKLFTSWDFLIGNFETAKNKAAEILTNLREAILEEKEKRREENRLMLTFLRVVANFLVMAVLGSSTYAIYRVVQFSQDIDKLLAEGQDVSWMESNSVSLVMSLITVLFPSLFDLIGLMEKYHPRINLRWALARILVLYLLNLYTLFMALYWKIQSKEDVYYSAQAALNSTVLCNSTVTGNWGNFTTVVTTVINCTEEGTAAPLYPKLELCWETMIGQEMVGLTVFDLVVTVMTIIGIDFIRGIAVRYLNPCWCWDLETKFPEYGEFKIAENLLHLIYNQGIIWMGTFFAPALPGMNIFKLLVMLYVRSWAVIVCNIPHERVFKASRSNNFYFSILLLMLFLSLLPVVFMLVQLKPSPDCGPLSGYEKHYYVLTDTIEQEFPLWFNEVMTYVASPGVIIPLMLLFIMAIYYLISLTRSLKEANADLRGQLEYERTEEKRKIYAMADARQKAKEKADDKAATKAQAKPPQGTKLLSTVPKPEINKPQRQQPPRQQPARQQPSRQQPPRQQPPRQQQPRQQPQRQAQLDNVKVVRVPGMSMEKAAVLKSRNPNLRIMSEQEARQLNLVPDARKFPDNSRMRRPPHHSPPVAVVHGKPVSTGRAGAQRQILPQHMQHRGKPEERYIV